MFLRDVREPAQEIVGAPVSSSAFSRARMLSMSPCYDSMLFVFLILQMFKLLPSEGQARERVPVLVPC